MKRLSKSKKYNSLEYQLLEILQNHAGQRGDNEGALDTLLRIIHERDTAMTKLALISMSKIGSF